MDRTTCKLVLLGLLTGIVGCEFDPPPDVNLIQPEAGAYHSGESIQVEFTEKVLPETLSIRIWPEVRDVEGQIPDGTVPALDSCRVDDSPCGEAVFSMVNKDRGADLLLSAEGLGQPDVPLILEVESGLSDLSGNTTGRSFFFDFQFVPPDPTTGEPPDEPVEFEDGVYIIVSSMDEPVPGIVLTFISELLSTDSNIVCLAGAEGDETGDAPKNTTDPARLIVDESPEGYTVFAVGQLGLDEDGERFLSTEPFGIDIWQGPLLVELKGTKLHAKIIKKDGHDHLEGTLSMSSATMSGGSASFDYPGTSASFVGVFAPLEVRPTGHPEICGELCGAVVEGQCNPPADFPPEGFCEALEAR